MKKKVLSLTILSILLFSLSACSSSEETNSTINNSTTSSTSEVVSNEDNTNIVEPTETPSENEKVEVPTSTQAPSEVVETPTPTQEPIPHEHAYDEGKVTTEATCNNVGTITYTCECGEVKYDNIPMLSHEYGEYTYNNDATYEKDGTESATCNLCGVVDTRTKDGTMLVKEPEPTIAPSGLDTTIGSDLAWSGNTITSHNGITISTLNKFNHAGLYNPPEEYVSSYDWFGYFDENGNGVCDPSVKNVVDNLLNIEDACSFLQGYTVWNDTIYMHFVTGGAAGALELRRHPSEGYYTIHINYDMSSGVGSEISVEDGRDALLGLCAMISSSPSELESAIYNDSFVDSATLSFDYYTTIGDCQVINYYGEENVTMVYAIKPN